MTGDHVARILADALASDQNVAALLVDPDGRLVFANRCAAQVFSLPRENPGTESLVDFVAEEDRTALGALLAGTWSDTPVLVRAANPEGALLVEASKAIPPEGAGEGYVLLLGHDAAEYLGLEQRRREQSRMVMAGRLAVGVAHDVNNALSTVTTFSDLAMASTPPDSPAAEDLNEIRQAALDAGRIARRFTLFAAGARGSVSEVHLPDVVAGAETLLRKYLTREVEVGTALSPNTPPVDVVLGELEEAIFILADWVRLAIGASGNISIRTAPAPGDQGQRRMARLEILGGDPDADLETFVDVTRQTLQSPMSDGVGGALISVDDFAARTKGRLTLLRDARGGFLARLELPEVADIGG